MYMYACIHGLDMDGLGHPIVLNSDDTLVLRLSVDHCWVLLPASGLAREQSHSSRTSNCRGIDREKAVINPGLLHTGHSHIPTVNGHVHPYTIRFTDGLAEAMGDKVTCLRSQQQGLGLGTGGT